MADWRQIQARIRKAKASSDPPAQLAELYERTRDAMVAFELAAWHEKAGNAAETVQWYTTAAQRFRRAQWRTKAEEALTRLGAPIPEPGPAAAPEPAESAPSESAPGLPYYTPSRSPIERGGVQDQDREGRWNSGQALRDSGQAEAERESPASGEEMEGTSPEGQGPAEEGAAAAGTAAGGAATPKRRRRGRRGGRKRRGRGGAGQVAPAEGAPRMARPARPGATSSSAAGRFHPAPARSFSPSSPDLGAGEAPFQSQGRPETEIESPPVRERSYEPAAPAWQAGSAGLTTSRPRAGDPGLSSRIAHLESQVRRLLACPLASLEEADQAPAGPGVLLLSDSDQVTHYYIEACQTLRIGIGNLLRGGRGSKGASQLKPSLADHLGISESRVAKYLKEHCAVRWIQLDEGAPALAHFATAVLRPVVAE